MEDKKEFKTSEARRKASQKWREKHKKQNAYISSRSAARTFAKKYAKSIDDIKELEEIFKNENENFDGKTEND